MLKYKVNHLRGKGELFMVREKRETFKDNARHSKNLVKVEVKIDYVEKLFQVNYFLILENV